MTNISTHVRNYVQKDVQYNARTYHKIFLQIYNCLQIAQTPMHGIVKITYYVQIRETMHKYCLFTVSTSAAGASTVGLFKYSTAQITHEDTVRNSLYAASKKEKKYSIFKNT